MQLNIYDRVYIDCVLVSVYCIGNIDPHHCQNDLLREKV